jgi:hypothetical protein
MKEEANINTYHEWSRLAMPVLLYKAEPYKPSSRPSIKAPRRVSPLAFFSRLPVGGLMVQKFLPGMIEVRKSLDLFKRTAVGSHWSMLIGILFRGT